MGSGSFNKQQPFNENEDGAFLDAKLQFLKSLLED